MEEFSQSRGDDDLFDDEIVPIEQTPEPIEEITSQVEQVNLEPAPTQPLTEQLPVHTSPSAQRGRGRGRARARGAPTRDTQRPNSLADSKYATKTTTEKKSTPAPQPLEKQVPQEPASPSAQDDSTVPPTAPTGPSNPTLARPPAVRGDRTATGGVRKPKLTEEELSEKLAAAKERSQNLAAAHARAQADAESFAERERIAIQKRAKETEDRKALEGERERNRERKLRAVGGREWDAGKDEQESTRGGRPPRRQGDFNEADHDLSIYEWREDRGRGRGRGRGRSGRGGRGRGDARNDGRELFQTQPDVHAEADFPALPPSKHVAPEKRLAPVRKESETATGSWADQVESSEAAKR